MASSRGLPLHCKICCKSFSGPAPAQQHFSSNEHRKKEQNSRTASSDPCYCKVCNISCDTLRMLENHVQSPRHLAMLERQQQMGKQCNPAAGDASSSNKEYVFNGTRGYCYVCKLDLTSPSHAQDHLKGQKHAKKKRQVDITQKVGIPTMRENVTTAATTATQPEYYCDICKVPFSGPESAQQHYSSEKHRKKEAIARQGHQQELKCDLCNTSFTGEENLRLHNMSDKHKRKVKLQEQKERGELLPLICSICGCSFTGQETAKQHFESQKHKRNLQNKQIQDKANFSGKPALNTSSVQQTIDTSQQLADLDKVTSGINGLNLVNSQDNLRQFQHITKKSQLEIEHDSPDLIKPFPVEGQNQERVNAAVIQEEDRIKPCEPDVIQTATNHQTEIPFGPNLTERSYTAQVESNKVHRHLVPGCAHPSTCDGGSHSTVTGYSDEEKIKQQEMRSMQGSSTTSVSGTSVDSFAQNDEPVRVIRNNLMPSLPSYGRGRAFLAMKNCNLLVGKQHNEGSQPDSTQPTKIETNRENTGFDHFLPKLEDDMNSNYQPNRSEGNSTRNQRDESNDRNYIVDGVIPDIIKPYNQSANEIIQPNSRSNVIFSEPSNKPELNLTKYEDSPVPMFHNGVSPLNADLKPGYPGFGSAISSLTRSGYDGTQANGTVEDFEEDFEGKELEEFTFDRLSHRGRCHVCNIELTSDNHMAQHTAGGKHRKAAQVWRRTQTGTRFIPRQLVCTLCNVTFSGPEARDQHNQSERHLQKQRLAAGQEKSYYCDICRVSCSGEVSYQQHLSGSQHRKLAGTSQQYGEMGTGIDKTMWYRCDICNCNLNSFEQLEIHKRSPRHLAKMSRAGTDSESSRSSSPLNLDRTTWYPCHVCNCNLNSQKQLRIHERSPGHLKQMQKTGYTANHPTEVRPEYQFQNGEDLPSFFGQGDSASMTPLESFLSIQLFPEELATDDDTNNIQPTETVQSQPLDNAPFNLVVSDSPVPYQEKFADLNSTTREQFKADSDDSGSGGTKRGQGSDLAFATRSRGNVDRKSDSLSDKIGPSADASHEENSTYGHSLGARPKERSTLHEQVNPYAATHRFYCHTCKAPMNTQESYENHLKGKRHMQKVCTEPAPIRVHYTARTLPESYMPQTVTSPRSYQVELYNKAMRRDALCFLPTGTGKTLVSVLVMSAMLEKQPSRNVLFLVDKVLLVLQQSKYIKQELQGFVFDRYNADSEDMSLVRRPIKVAAVCMGQQNTGGVPLWKHDVVVVTAAFCQNLLDKNILRWQDFSLVVFDEAHHCEKLHPYNALLKTFHSSIPRDQFRPKILGLTASPAGKADVPKTLQMLEGLIFNMGGVSMTVVEEPDNIHILREYQSNAKMIIHTQSGEDKTQDCSGFIHEINVYIVHCYLKLSQISNINFFINVIGVGMSSGNIDSIADSFVERNIDVLQSSLASLSSNEMEKVNFSLLLSHVREICMARSSLDEGVLSMMEDFVELANTDYGFKFAISVGLPCQRIEGLVYKLATEDQSMATKKSDVNVDLLLRVLTDTTGSTMKDRRNSISLVLVKMRGTAFRITRILKQSAELRRLGLDTATVVGHGGSGAGDKGMSVNQQKRVLEDIKQYKYQIIVATSVAEEGVDWPECERVISMYPPSTVTALVQMRGRARRKNSQFIVLCASQAEEDKLRDIMNREQNMIQATQILVDRDRQYGGRQN